MYLNDFSVRIPEGNETPGGYVELAHNTQYRLVLGNRRSRRCDARVEIDGKHVGTWRIGANGSITLERPAHDPGQFTFYEVGTQEAVAAGLDRFDPNLGLVKVVFTPERYEEPAIYSLSNTYGYAQPKGLTYGGSTRGFSRAGGTGLSGQSGQRFTDAEGISYDFSQQTTIHLRLVSRGGGNEGPRPLTAFSTPVPPSV